MKKSGRVLDTFLQNWGSSVHKNIGDFNLMHS
jgi:hypothetical protein